MVRAWSRNPLVEKYVIDRAPDIDGRTSPFARHHFIQLSGE